MVICNEEHRFLVAERLRQLNELPSNIILEPVGCNTAPAAALAALQATRYSDGPLTLVLATDHITNSQSALHDDIRVSEQYADGGHLVTFGIVPNAPKAGYGYIQRGIALTDNAHAPYRVACFVEKPDRERAEVYPASEEYYWNSGMFMFRAEKYLSELAKYRPDILETCQAAVNAADNGSDFIDIPRDIFCKHPDESVDHTVTERTADAVVVGLNADWSDVGFWSAPWEVSPEDGQGNVLSDDAWVRNSRNYYINSSEKLVVVIGVENLMVVSTKDTVLVMNREHSQDVRKAVEFLKQDQRSEYKRHREIYHPQDRCDVVVQTPRFNVNHITVKPGGAFSMQMHHRRAEHRVILAGTGQVMVSDGQFLLSENQSTFIPIGTEHYPENPGCIPLEVLEIQSGSYLGEDDIIRIKGQYSRC